MSKSMGMLTTTSTQIPFYYSPSAIKTQGIFGEEVSDIIFISPPLLIACAFSKATCVPSYNILILKDSNFDILKVERLKSTSVSIRDRINLYNTKFVI